MTLHCGVAIGHSVTAVLVGAERGVAARAEFELPAGAVRGDVLLRSVTGALEGLGAYPSCDSVGIAFSPADRDLAATLVHDGNGDPHLPLVGGMRAAFVGSEVDALLALFAGGRNKAWIMLDDPPRLYAEQGEAGELIEATDRKGRSRAIRYQSARDIIEPLTVLILRLGLVESIDDIRELAEIGRDSAGVRFVRRVQAAADADRDDGFAIMGIREGVRRPQIACAALEAVGLEVRAALADLAGEAAVEELYAAGTYAASEALTDVIADMIAAPVIRSAEPHAVAWGAASRAAAAPPCGVELPQPARLRSNPSMPAAKRDAIFARWAIARRDEP